jgi:hypothetical protein
MSSEVEHSTFEENYLRCASALETMRERLMWIGMSGNANFERLCADFIKHGAETFHDIKGGDRK